MTCLRLRRAAMAFLLASVVKHRSAAAFVTRSPRTRSSLSSLQVSVSSQEAQKFINLHTIPKEELEQVLQSWGFPKYRASQVITWVRHQGVTDVTKMTNIPLNLRETLQEFATAGSLTLDTEEVSKDGTKKRAYRLHDGQLIESVLMPYDDGRYTACISSQAGCAMGCVFCATGQMGFARQLSSDEILEQVSRFSSELSRENARLSNVVFMGMGEPLANYRNVMDAVSRITKDLGIGARKITISTVGVVPNIRKLYQQQQDGVEMMPQVRLAVSLHCASDEERSALLPANQRYGGLGELMSTLKEYIDTTGRRITLEWALIEKQNDTPETARKLGQLIHSHKLRRDMVHINVIPLNPTGGFAGSPSGRSRVNEFIQILEQEFGISTTPRVRRGIDINAGCGQLKSKIQKKEEEKQEVVESSLKSFLDVTKPPMIGVYQDEQPKMTKEVVEFEVDKDAVDFDSDDFEDPEFENELQHQEAARLISLVENSFPTPTKTTSITDADAIHESKRRRKKLLKNLKAIQNLLNLEKSGRVLNDEQRLKVSRLEEFKQELESVQHNLQ